LIQQTSGSSGTQSTVDVPKRTNQMGKDAFLQLLTTQLAHQDPTAPQDNAQMIAQLAQFSTLEQLTTMNEKLDAIGVAFGIPSTNDPSSSESTTERTT
jgi:flagellar basal-body rod modification protein FlgD